MKGKISLLQTNPLPFISISPNLHEFQPPPSGYDTMQDTPSAPPPYTAHLETYATGAGLHLPGNNQPVFAQPTIVHLPQVNHHRVMTNNNRECCCCCCTCPFWVCCLIMAMLIGIPLINLLIFGGK